MFQTLFRYPKVRARHEHSPLATERRAYLSHRADLGSPKSTLRKWANELLVVCRELRLSAPRTVSPSQIRHAAQRWAKRQRRRGRARTCLWAQTLFVQTATAWLKFTGRLRERPIRTEAILKAFGRSVRALALHRIGRREVRSYLDGAGSVTTFWHRKWTSLRGFYRFALARRWVGQSPLPITPPKVSAPFVPYIFSRAELKRLLTDNGRGPSAQPVPQASLRMLLSLLYGAGLRLSEALRLECADVDWETGVLTVRDTKFFKTRLVPLAPALADRLRHHLRDQRRLRPGHDPTASVLINRRGGRVTRSQAETTFRRLRGRLQIQRPGGTRQQPRLHDLRHSFAVHRLIQCYRQGAETPRLLHGLSIYLGHRNLSATQRYLTMTPELLELASQRFEAYATVHSHRP